MTQSHTHKEDEALQVVADAELHEFKVRLTEYGMAMRNSEGARAQVLSDVLVSMLQSFAASRPVAGVTDAENEKFSRDVSNFKGSDPEATKFALEQFAASRAPVAVGVDIGVVTPAMLKPMSANERAQLKTALAEVFSWQVTTPSASAGGSVGAEPAKVNHLIGLSRRLQGFANRLTTTNAILAKEVRDVAYDVENTAQSIYDGMEAA